MLYFRNAFVITQLKPLNSRRFKFDLALLEPQKYPYVDVF